MLETRFKVIFLLVVLFAASLPVIAILRGTVSTPYEALSLGRPNRIREPPILSWPPLRNLLKKSSL